MTDSQLEQIAQLIIHCFAVLVWAQGKKVSVQVVRENCQLAWERIKVGL